MAPEMRVPLQGEQPPRPASPGKKWTKVTKAVNGIDTEEWVEVDDVETVAWPARDAMRLLNHELPRVDGPDKVSGRAVYAHDVRLPGMVYARILGCPHPAAKVELDLEAARELEGVVDVRSLETETRWLGQPIAAVAALTPERAEDAVRAIVARYEPLPFSITPEQSLADGAPRVTKNGNIARPQTRGDLAEVEAAFADADVVVEGTWKIPVQHHACLETHGLVADYRGGETATVYGSTQGTFALLEGLPKALGLPASAVTTVVEHMGGGFGGKFGPDVWGRVACEIARDLKRPVHMLLTREQEFLAAGNRSGGEHTLKAGATKDGKLVAFHAKVSRTGGLNPGGGSNQPQPYIYSPAVSYVESRGVWTNLDASRAMRAPGHPQASFAMEGLMDELAYRVAMDPLEFRVANLPAGGREAWTRQLRRCAEAIGWKEHAHKTAHDASDAEKKVGIGFALSTWGGGGGDACKVDVRIASDGSVEVASGTQDLGTGTRTYMAAIVAEELGLELSQVTARIGRSSYGNANGSGGSTTAASLAPSVKHAAHMARLALFEKVAPALGAKPGELALEPGKVVALSNRSKTLAWKDACARIGPQPLAVRGEWQSDLAGNGVQGAQAAKVEVDTLTGEVKVLHMVCVQNCGLALNRMAAKSQILGGMVQALSYGLFEERVVDPDLGIQLNASFVDYKLAGCREIGRMEAILDDADERGVIGLGEPPVIPGQSAIGNAIYNACGVRLYEMPFTCDKLLMGLVEQRKG